MKPGFQKILDEYHSLTEQMSSGASSDFSPTGGPAAGWDMAKLGRRQAELLPTVEKIQRLQSLEKQVEENTHLLENEDAEIKSMAVEEINLLENQMVELLNAIEEALIPKDPNDDKTSIIEMRAGAGGDEATLFVAEMFRAYGKYAETHGWRIHKVSDSKSEAGGFKEVIFEVQGPCYGKFKYESGVHRVQRVPQTEKQGRVHTSTITIAVMPELEEKDYAIDQKDLKIEATTSQGAGGQSVNTTYSAIRVVHIPTGIMATCQDERSQAQNKEKALTVIRARVAAHYREIDEKKITDARRSQIGTGDRSEKIRTYNFPQDRVTDHRINQNFSQVNLIMEGQFEPIISALQKADLALKKETIQS